MRTHPTSTESELWICWTIPTETPTSNTIILSFLPPEAESELGERGYNILWAREVSERVRNQVKAEYTRVCSDIGTFESTPGTTYRSTLRTSNSNNIWWNHPVAAKDNESSKIYDNLIALFTILKVSTDTNVNDLRFYGAAPEIVSCFEANFKCRSIDPKIQKFLTIGFLRGLLTRLKYLTKMIYETCLAKIILNKTPIPRSLDAAIMGFWDWSVSQAKDSIGIVDNYLKELSTSLLGVGFANVGWFVWIDSATSSANKKLPFLCRWLSPLKDQSNYIVLHRFLTIRSLFREFLRINPFFQFLKIRNTQHFKDLFLTSSVNLYPLFKYDLFYGYVGSVVPILSLYNEAVKAASIATSPKVACSLLEHFPHGRAFYSGVRGGSPSTVLVAIQHASYNSEKTILALDPRTEYLGEPDGVCSPHPDYFCTMGNLGRTLILSCGYPDSSVCVTGSPRFSHVALKPINSTKDARNSQDRVITVMTGLSDAADLDIIEAVFEASKGIKNLTFRLRKHPYSEITKKRQYSKFKGSFTLSTASLLEDIGSSQLVIFSYSTAAEEAFFSGTPVWQWRSLGFNASALSEVAPIPRFSTVSALRECLLRFSDSIDITETQTNFDYASILKELYFFADGNEARRVAQFIRSNVLDRSDQVACS